MWGEEKVPGGAINEQAREGLLAADSAGLLTRSFKE